MKYIIDKSWFVENGDDVFTLERAGSKHQVYISPGMELSDKVLDMLYHLKRPYISLAESCGTTKCEAPKELKSNKKVKTDEPRKAKKELQKEVSTKASKKE